jgi:hypothetical protein
VWLSPFSPANFVEMAKEKNLLCHCRCFKGEVITSVSGGRTRIFFLSGEIEGLLLERKWVRMHCLKSVNKQVNLMKPFNLMKSISQF